MFFFARNLYIRHSSGYGVMQTGDLVGIFNYESIIGWVNFKTILWNLQPDERNVKNEQGRGFADFVFSMNGAEFKYEWLKIIEVIK